MDTRPDPALAARLEKLLKAKLSELGRELDDRERETSELLPADSEEAAPVKEEIELREAEEEHEARELRLVTEALERLRTGRYGSCGTCGGRIPDERLLAVPWAANCVACQGRAESRAGR
ncbi:MAG: RNA polymerase-binding transcription factor DksA [Candidatus Omnitrophica bacterium]|nr:RNA polymerase-binding transcription factor DksA [Candidatus Omnitrophota bacterium]